MGVKGSEWGSGVLHPVMIGLSVWLIAHFFRLYTCAAVACVEGLG